MDVSSLMDIIGTYMQVSIFVSLNVKQNASYITYPR